MLSAGHTCVDICQGAVPALIPFLVHQRHYSYASATALILAMTFTSSLIQPLFGHLADRRSLSMLLPLGILTAGAGIAAVGLTSSYGVTFALIAVSGLGVGAYHPEGARFANYVSGRRRASGMSLFSVGGNIGFALGPILVTPLVLAFGLGGVVWLIIPPTLIAVLLFKELPRLSGFRPPADDELSADSKRAARAGDRPLPFAGVATVAGLRSVTYFGLQAFVPLYLIREMGTTTALGNTALTVLLVFGAIGTLVGGRLAERFGTKAVLVGFIGSLTPLILLFLVSGEAIGIALLAVIGFFTVGTFSITVVMGQQFLPSRIGIASGVTLGAAIGAGGLAAYLLGLLADHSGLGPVMILIALAPLPALLIALRLPAGRRMKEFDGHEPGSDRDLDRTAAATAQR